MIPVLFKEKLIVVREPSLSIFIESSSEIRRASSNLEEDKYEGRLV